MRDEQKYATIVALFATVLYLALVVAALGLISLATNNDVIQQADAGPLVGPTMSGAAVITVFVMLLIEGVGRPPAEQYVAVGFAFLTGVLTYAVFILVGAALYALGTGALFDVLTFTESMLVSPFALAVGILAVIVTLVYSWILAARVGEHGRPLWPWERRGE
ncbi:DUF6121 family protein [Glaciibacter psychrotolerans]|uniref:Heme/copper-type cytochrome/quinol oxidase subunit 2 n=1 Tax=Glaciibacter psychrotolerans TaxID=670054 RepID=A0A7Z0EH53_9MICO|nr:DUF6121 family protein [Leifsonia psychrotolerans]NYJ21543.1 heme/copper-type cytochrome/quinol oxidase subunit 2 [Leifsonia psychrotolerans]